ncbi:MAG: glycosyltransferase family 39 protein [Candidatus Bathyarchaeia archaeon]
MDKLDIAALTVLSIAFFSLAVWNLGMASVPLTTWTPFEGASFYIDLGSLEYVDAVYFLIKNGEISVKVYTGSPATWNEEVTDYQRDYHYYSWKEVRVASETRFVRFVFSRSYGEIAELAVLSREAEKLSVSIIRNERGSDEELLNLIDEQEKVECPPTYMSQTYFDEIYFVRAAEDYLNLRDPYEWTHPPLGKLIITVAVLAFGYNPFGWRIMGVVFATLMIPVIYFLGKKLFGTRVGALASAILLTFDFMHLTMGRIATVDTFLVFFSLTSHFFFFTYFQNVLRIGWKASKRPLFLAVLFFGLGFSTKWYTLFGFVGQVFLLLLLRFKTVMAAKEGWTMRIKTFFSSPFVAFLGFVAVAAAVYLATFIPHILVGYSLKDICDLQFSMYHYHSTLTATHPYSSPWWSWPLMANPLESKPVPVWLYVSYLPGNIVSTIVAMGNPAVWWLGFASIICLVEETARTKDYSMGFILAIFLSQWLPYAFISRCLFLYHFYFNVPFLILAIVRFLNDSWSRRWCRTLWLFYLILVGVLFALFYPVISGFPTPCWWRDSLRLFSGWVF